MKKLFSVLLVAVMMLSLVASASAAEIWSSGKTVYVDVGARAGGGTDLLIRYMTKALGELNPGVNFVVNNYDVGDVGLAHAAYAKPDGLTLSVISVGNTSNYHAGTSNFKPLEMFKIAAKVVNGGPQAFVATAGAPYSNMAELVDYIRSGEKKLKIGVQLGGVSHFAWLNTFNAIDPELNNMVNYVQAGGEADKLTNIASGSIDLANCSMNNSIAYEADGKLVVLGTIGPDAATREATAALVGQELAENYASMPEQNISYCLNAGTYIVVPVGCSDEVVEYINAKFMELVGNQTYEDGMRTMGQFSGVKNVADSLADYEAEVAETLAVMEELNMVVVK